MLAGFQRARVVQLAYALLTSVPLARSLPSNHTNDQTGADIDAGSFQSPSNNVRPRFRYWIPDASVELDAIASDIAAAGKVGAGGVEILGFYSYGASEGEVVPVDWATYGWGTPAWRTLFDAAAQAHIDNGLIMDFAMGPALGAGVPAQLPNDGLTWDLRMSSASVPLDGSHSFSGIVPGWGTGLLQAVITAIAKESRNATESTPGLPNSMGNDRVQVTLAASTIQDITPQVGSDGSLNMTFDSDQPSDGLERLIFAVYLYQTNSVVQQGPQHISGPQTTPSSFVGNGSWYVDHFSAAGAKVMTDFWEDYILVNGTKEKVMQIGNYGWEDSIELDANIYWTKDLPNLFQTQHNYSINQWLPILLHQNSLNSHFATWYITDDIDSGNSRIADYRETLTRCYGDYLSALTTWANDYLDLQYSAQVGYNMAVDMQSVIPNVNAPETESLAFGESIDAYRQYTAPAQMAGKRVISTEAEATGSCYQQTLPELLWSYRRSVAGGINNIVFHGLAYGGDYPNTTWPGFTTFTFAFSEMHGPRQPGWDYYTDSVNYIARLQYLFQSGVSRLDIAFYQKITSYRVVGRSYEPTDLEQAGYTYGYLNPDNLALPNAQVSNGVLAPDGEAYKALVVRGTEPLTTEGANKIAELARQGLPVIFINGTPSYFASYDPVGAAQANESIQGMLSLGNVHLISSDLAAYLEQIDISPSTRITSDSTWYTAWRHDENSKSDYVFIFNDSPRGSSINATTHSQGTINFQSIGVPYFMDAWSGQETPILNYTQTSSTTTIFLELATNQGIVIAFKNADQASLHVTSAPPQVIGFTSDNGTLRAHVASCANGCSSTEVQSSDGQTHDVTSTPAEPFNLANWTLTVEHWDPPSPLTRPAAEAVKHNTTHNIGNLVSWQTINELRNVSGRGYYSTTFGWPPTNGKANGAMISFGPIYHTIQASINGVQLPSLDTTWAEADISQYVSNGTNTIDVVISTNLGNVLNPIWNQLLVGGRGPIGAFNVPLPAPAITDYGLLHPAIITPYVSVDLA